MPELPEIETIKRVIGPQIEGLTIQRITVNRPEVIAHPSADEFCRRITGQIFTETRRRGKFLILCMDSGDRLILHLRMTGCLLDQSVIAGIGNIYSDEILFAARIHPARPANTLTAEEWNRLASVIPERLAFFIKKNKTTPEEYLETKGQDYRNTPFLQVYGHGGEPCPICGEILCRTVLGGRSSVYCPTCQKI